MYKFHILADVIMEEIVLIKHSLVTGQEVLLSMEHEYFLEDLDGSIDDLVIESAQAEMLAGESNHCETAQWLANQYKEVKAAWWEKRTKDVKSEDIPF